MKKYFFFLVIQCAICFQSYSQSWGDSTLLNQPFFISAEENPKFPGGQAAFYDFVSKNLKSPQLENPRTPMTVTVRIFLTDSGKAAYADIVKDKHYGGQRESAYNNAALELFKKMPVWIPAKQNGYRVTFVLIIPVVFLD